MSLPRRLGQVRFADLLVLDQLRTNSSAAAVARVLGTTTSQVTKTLRKLEAAFGEPLVDRGPHGMRPNAAATALLAELAPAVSRLRSRKTVAHKRLTAAAPSYLLQTLLRALSAPLRKGRLLRAIDLSPSAIAAQLPTGLYDVALVHGDLMSTHLRRYACEQVGWLPFGLFASRKMAEDLGSGPIDPNRIRSLPFVRPVYRTDDGFSPGSDGCPLPPAERTFGHEVQTITAALALVSESDHVAFGPTIASRGVPVVEIHVSGWDVCEPVHLFSNADTVTASELRHMKNAIQHALTALTPRVPRRR